MAVSSGDLPDESPPSGDRLSATGEEEYEDEEGDESDEGEEEEEEAPATAKSRLQSDKAKMMKLMNRLKSEPVTLRVHDVIIKGNTKTKDSVIEAEIVDELKKANTLQEIFQAAAIANARLRQLEIFDSISLMVDAGPPELPGTANVVVEVSETKRPLAGEIALFTKQGVISISF